MADGKQAGVRADQACCGFNIDDAVCVERQYDQLRVLAPRQLLPGQQVGVVLQGADDDFITRCDQVFQAVSQQIQRFCGAAGEDDFGRTGGVEPASHLDP